MGTPAEFAEMLALFDGGQQRLILGPGIRERRIAELRDYALTKAPAEWSEQQREEAARAVISLPMFPELTAEEVDFAIAKVLEWDKAV